jgi:multiple sugar transport system substrate-binding protein
MRRSGITKMTTVLITAAIIVIIIVAGLAYVYLTPSTEPPVTGLEFYREAGKPYAGTTIRVAYLTGEYFDEYCRAVLAPEFEELTGIKVLVDDMGAGALMDKLLADFRAGRTSYDEVAITAFFGLGLFYQEGGTGYFQDLSPYFLNSSLADPDYDFADLDHRHLNYLGYWNHTTKMQGEWVGPGIEGTGTLYMIPGPHTDTMLLTYNREILEEYNQKVPTTWEEFLTVAEACTHPDDEVWGATFIGIPLLHFIGEFAPRFASYANAPVGSSPYVTGTILEGNLMPQMNSSAVKDALNNEIALLQYIPPGATSWDISNAQDAFALGKCAMMVQHASMIGSVYKPDTSLVYDKINSTLLPGPPGAALRGGWGRGISKFSANKEATFLWLQYSSRKAADFGANLIYGMNPIRSSTFQRPEFIEKFPFALKSLEASQIGHYIPVYLPSILELMVNTDIVFIDIVIGSKTVDEGTAEVQQIWIDTLKADGLIP